MQYYKLVLVNYCSILNFNLVDLVRITVSPLYRFPRSRYAIFVYNYEVLYVYKAK